MSALNPLTPRNPNDERSSQEPSMEEILASIRRIISDDQSLAAPHDQDRAKNNSGTASDTSAASASPKWPYPDAPIENRRLKDTASEARDPVSPEPSPFERRRSEPYFKPAAADSKPFFSRQSEPKRPESKSADLGDMELRRRLDEETDRSPEPPKLRRSIDAAGVDIHEEVPIVSPATDAAVASSFNSLFASQLLPSSEMLAELAREMLRPMLKAWLDDNLPVMVERLVRAEIERVARGGR